MNARLRRRAAIAVVCSAAVHVIVAALWNFYHEPRPQAIVMISGRISIEHRPKSPPPPPPAQRQPVEPEKAHVKTAAQAVPPPQARTEESHVSDRAKTYQPKRSHSRANTSSTVPQVDFSKTIAQLRAQNDPVAGAQRPVDTGGHTARVSSDFSTSVGTGGAGNGYLEPVQSWRDEGYDYYRVHYSVEYADGSTEDGIVPWPIRYRPQVDPFRLGIHRMPLPLPLPDFVPPAGTAMHPLVFYCWEHREELAMDYGSCPIDHD